MTRRLALLVYYTRDEWPLRASIASHIRALMNWPDQETIAVNVAFPFDIKLIASLPFDVIIYHTTAVALRWYPSGIEALNPLAIAFANHRAYKIALPQDDYMHTQPLCRWLNLARVDLVLSPMRGKARQLAYETLNPAIKLETILTTYLEARDIEHARSRRYRPMADRAFYVSYRAWDARPWVGKAGQQKINVGRAAAASCERLNKPYDISSDPKETIMGAAWFDFLSNTRAVVGVEGGSSLHDPDGTIFERVEAYLAANPKASYERVVQDVLGNDDDHAEFTAMSPRHFEAVFTKTAQILVEGGYSGVLQPDLHYIPIKADFSNMDEAILKLNDTAALDLMVDRAWRDIIDTPVYYWDSFLTDLAKRHLPEPSGTLGQRDRWHLWWLMRRNDFNYVLLQLELAWSRAPPIVKQSLSILFRPLRYMLNRPPGWS